MRILVTGGTGNVGGAVVMELLKRGTEVRVLARKQPEAGKLSAGVEVAIGDLLDPVSVEQAMQGVDKLFLLNAVVTDELTQALIAYGIARRVGLKHVTYLSVFKVDQFRDVPHFASKLAVEGTLREFGIPYTILRPGYYIQNDATLKDALLGAGVYPMPIGTAGIAAADVRDIAEAAAISLTEDGHDGQTSVEQVAGQGDQVHRAQLRSMGAGHALQDAELERLRSSHDVPGLLRPRVRVDRNGSRAPYEAPRSCAAQL
jgi:uncharacterized protein YbjT (DUF2867 family)